MRSPVELFTETLRSHSNRVLSERQDSYTLVVVSIDNRDVVLCLSKGHYTSTYYVKLALTDDLNSLDCVELEYSPQGLYVFSEDPVSLAENAIKKAKILVKRSR